ncbi:maleylpyruvate isomerase family mycothiol-dependent enzyme [Tsukamurella tyrosinosolvens]|uniref:maleylpyruvate isomerase family mycothiol-dependent enzyme n=1 Tax=Tsukamurella tyrosinosolvens TaxID=57704 RepID=UPI002DD42778|nr:maleylpyruvate isomerase family mycothiol-dependent enzyme [Tsukamurella tyrosinosolvens]MEC4615572.1 maleylpyruvate isomerase family mycothiol-dependent enzyme [Tsukamurella tyrosinosolvens]
MSATAFRDLPLGEQLTWCRRGTAHFARALGDLSDVDLLLPSALDGWTRRHLVAHVAYNAAALCRLMDWARTGVETPMYASPSARNEEIDSGATLNPAALRNLNDHTVARLDERWRNATGAVWRAPVRTAQGRDVAAAETVWMRTREVWVHTVDLGAGARFGDIPPVVLDGLLGDIVAKWRGTGDGGRYVLRIVGRDQLSVDPAGSSRDPVVVEGDLAAVTRWAAGRGAVGLAAPVPGAPPRWL